MLIGYSNRSGSSAAFSTIEVLIGIGIMGMLYGGIFGGLRMGFMVGAGNHEDLRAIQILEEKMDTIRLYTWEQLNTKGFIPATFIEPYNQGATQESNPFSYSGSCTIEVPQFKESYGQNVRKVTFSVTWTNQGIAKSQSMVTLVSAPGMQKYIYGSSEK